jgi:hypothetical protein
MNNSVLKNVTAALEEIKEVDLTGEGEGYVKAKSPITVWLPPEYKDKFDHYQKMTDRKFGKLVQKLLKKAIDSVES